MSSVLIKSITIAAPGSSLNGKTLDVLVVDGRLEKAEKGISVSADTEINGEGFFISQGWIDSLAYCNEPGEEWKEDLYSLAAAAAAGGFTSVAAICGSSPVPDSAAAVSAVLKKSRGLAAEILPIGTATKGKNGKELAEIFDMKSAGAVAFSDGDSPIKDAGMCSRIMEYTNNCGAAFLQFPFDPTLAVHGMVHDGIQSNTMGLKGIPSVSESGKVAEAIQLAAWLKTPLRLAGVSCAESVEWIRNAKKQGQEIYAAVPVMNLLLTDADIDNFDENCKVMPPLRTEKDRAALISGLMDGTLDAVYSNHQAQDVENKNVEFEYAAFGANNIQATFGILIKALGKSAKAEIIAEKLSIGPAKLLNTEISSFEIGSKLNFTLFTLTGSWLWNAGANRSKSRNSPFFGEQISGQVLGTICNGEWQGTTAILNK